jgi:hypothetical protein
MGVWILRSAYGERFDTKERIVLFGENPRGVLMLNESGRMAALITPSLQRDDPPPTPRQLVAYSGRFTIGPPRPVEFFDGAVGVDVLRWAREAAA